MELRDEDGDGLMGLVFVPAKEIANPVFHLLLEIGPMVLIEPDKPVNILFEDDVVGVVKLLGYFAAPANLY